MSKLATLLMIAAVADPVAWSGEAKEYPLTLKVLETDAVTSKADGTKTTTNCTSSPASGDVNCTSRQTPVSEHTDLFSIVEASDGNTYSIACVQGVGGSFLGGAGRAMAADAGLSTVNGCMVPPGTYKARWDKGQLKVLHEKNGKFKETTFTVLSSKPTVHSETAPRAASPNSSALLRISSSPPGADIEIDGKFIGQTPSSVPAASGDHSVVIRKVGYKLWERTIATSGGEITIAAELESEAK
jgi:PEGA domain